MTKLEKVIKGLECCTAELETNQHRSDFCTVCPYKDKDPAVWYCFNKHELMCDALALLKAQAPVEPILDIDEWKCGNCGHTLEHQELLGDNVLFHEQYNYCPECGRKVKLDGCKARN